jgi:hypothetical protein
MNRRKYNSRHFEEIPIIVVDPPPMDPKPNSVHETSLNVEGKDGDEGEERPPEASERRLSLRRNSISLPNLDDLQVLKQHVQVQFFSNLMNERNLILTTFYWFRTVVLIFYAFG